MRLQMGILLRYIIFLLFFAIFSHIFICILEQLIFSSESTANLPDEEDLVLFDEEENFQRSFENSLESSEELLRSEELAEESTQVVDGTSAQGHNAPKVATPEGKAKENNEDPEDAHPGPPKLSTSHKPRNIFEDIMMDEAFHEERLRVQREMKLKKRKQQQQQQNILAMKAK